MIVAREIKTMLSSDLVNYVADSSLDGYLSKEEFQEIMLELQLRGTHAEVLASLNRFGKPQWRKYETAYST